MSRLLKILPVVALALIVAVPALAQGGLSDEQQATLDRLIAAVDASESYQSYSRHAVETTTQELTLNLGGTLMDATETEVVEKTAVFAYDDEGQVNIQGEFTATVTSQPLGAGAPFEYVLTGEVRLVSGVLYVRAERESENEASLPPMPEGWVIVESAEDWPALDVLELDDLLENQDSPDIFDASVPDVLALASDVSTSPGTLDDGTVVEVISLTLDKAALGDALSLLAADQEPLSPEVEAYYAGLDDVSRWDMVFSLSEAGDVVHFTSDTQLSWTEFDISILSSDLPPGTLLDQQGQLLGEFDITAINEPVEPVEAPVIE